jgi:hypothetical protein
MAKRLLESSVTNPSNGSFFSFQENCNPATDFMLEIMIVVEADLRAFMGVRISEYHHHLISSMGICRPSLFSSQEKRNN